MRFMFSISGFQFCDKLLRNTDFCLFLFREELKIMMNEQMKEKYIIGPRPCQSRKMTLGGKGGKSFDHHCNFGLFQAPSSGKSPESAPTATLVLPSAPLAGQLQAIFLLSPVPSYCLQCSRYCLPCARAPVPEPWA